MEEGDSDLGYRRGRLLEGSMSLWPLFGDDEGIQSDSSVDVDGMMDAARLEKPCRWSVEAAEENGDDSVTRRTRLFRLYRVVGPRRRAETEVIFEVPANRRSDRRHKETTQENVDFDDCDSMKMNQKGRRTSYTVTLESKETTNVGASCFAVTT
jgi:hypothetical protein